MRLDSTKPDNSNCTCSASVDVYGHHALDHGRLRWAFDESSNFADVDAVAVVVAAA